MASRPGWLERALSRMNPPVFLGSAGTIVAFVAFGTLASETALGLFRDLQDAIVHSLGWLYVTTATALLLFALYVGLGPYHSIRLGGETSEPEFGTATWLAMLLAAILLVFVLATGPTVYILDLFVASLGAYLQALPVFSLWTDPGGSGDWQARWTLFYWSWWISWSPFVGVFVARISRGRTLREFVLGALIVPSLISFLWFTAVGGSAIRAAESGAPELLERIAEEASLSFFLVLEVLPWAGITQVAVTLLVLVFFVTSSDSGSLVDDMVTSGGHPDPPRAQRVFWAVAEGAVAATLVLAGGLEALRMASLTTGLPLAVFLLVASFGLLRALRRDRAFPGVPERNALQRATD